LSTPEDSGPQWFWWNTRVLSRDWLRERLDEQAYAADERYRPELQVDVAIEEDLGALGFDQSIVDEYKRLRLWVIADEQLGRPAIWPEGLHQAPWVDQEESKGADDVV
jgi:hypothetical protein